MRVKKYIMACIFLMSSPLAVDFAFASDGFDRTQYGRTEKTIRLSLYKDYEQYRVNSMEVILADIPYEKTYDLFKGKIHNGCIVSFRKEILGCFGAGVMKIIRCVDSFAPDGTISGGCHEVPEGAIIASIPYFPNGKYADIYDPEGKKIMNIDLSGKATCNEDNVCNRPIEDRSNCRQDCKDGELGAGLSASQKAQEQAGNDSPKEVSWKLNVAGIFVFMVSVGGVLFMWWRWRQYRSTLNNW